MLKKKRQTRCDVSQCDVSAAKWKDKCKTHTWTINWVYETTYTLPYGVRTLQQQQKRVKNLIWHPRALPQYNLTDCGASCARLQLKLKLKLNSHKITWNVQKMRKFFEIENNVWVADMRDTHKMSCLMWFWLNALCVDWKPEKRLRHFVFVINYLLSTRGCYWLCFLFNIEMYKAGISAKIWGNYNKEEFRTKL